MIDQLEQIPEDAEGRIPIKLLKGLIYERHDALATLSLVLDAVSQFAAGVIDEIPCEKGFAFPEAVSADGRSEDELADDELIEVDLSCKCLRCRTICVKAAVKCISEDWDLTLLEGDAIMGSYRKEGGPS